MKYNHTIITLLIATALAGIGREAKAQDKIQSQWDGARVAFLGDSITDERQLSSQDIYWNQLTGILGIKPYCYGISGHRASDIMGQAGKLIKDHGQDVDAILIFIGTNDFNGNVPLGEWFTEKSCETIKNGSKVILKRRTPVMDGGTVRSEINRFMTFLKHNYPTKQIVLLTPIHRAYFNCSDTNIQPDENYANTLGLYIDQYVDVIKEAANVWAVPVIDLNAICGLYPLEENHVRYFREAGKDPEGTRHDLLHPNTEGHMRMALSIAYQLLMYPSKFPDTGEALIQQK